MTRFFIGIQFFFGGGGGVSEEFSISISFGAPCYEVTCRIKNY